METLFRIKVSRADIANGVANDCDKCAITRAVQRTLSDTSALTVKSWIYARGRRYSCSRAVTEWIRAFDDGENVEPFTLLLNRNDSGGLLTARMEEEAMEEEA